MKRTGVKTPETAPAPACFSGRKGIIPGFLRNRSQKAAVRLDPAEASAWFKAAPGHWRPSGFIRPEGHRPWHG
ncbi:MAG: hypothetical protein C6P37_14300 [Caldibacillus debilis]|uniref:Uncharacterized protein n=1 Tax=Caldibacillus debilis TaxID=301148 RepID=A0A3E0K0F3_9BACI|nr:MAG: hypothetical protein C6P37_14300 [Caldibacillus debilis]